MAIWVKVAEIEESAVRLKVQSPVPVHPEADPVPPDQPAKTEPALGLPESVMDAPSVTVQVPVLPDQFNVQPVAVTLPEPVPDFSIVRVLWTRSKVAVQDLAPFIVT